MSDDGIDKKTTIRKAVLRGLLPCPACDGKKRVWKDNIHDYELCEFCCEEDECATNSAVATANLHPMTLETIRRAVDLLPKELVENVEFEVISSPMISEDCFLVVNRTFWRKVLEFDFNRINLKEDLKKNIFLIKKADVDKLEIKEGEMSMNWKLDFKFSPWNWWIGFCRFSLTQNEYILIQLIPMLTFRAKRKICQSRPPRH